MNDHFESPEREDSSALKADVRCQLFEASPGVPLSTALSRASGMLSTALVLCDETCDETCDSELTTTRALNQAIYQLVDAGKILIDAARADAEQRLKL